MARYTSVVTINLSVFLLMLGVGMIVALLPQRIMNLSGSIASVGYLASAYAISNVLFQIPTGSLSDIFGFKPFIVGGYFLCSLTGLLYYFSETPNLIFFGRMLQGIGEVPIWAIAPALLSIQFPAKKGKFMGIYNASLHCGLMAGSLLGILIYRIWQGNEAFLFYAAVSFLGGLLILLFVENPHKKTFVKTKKIDPGRIVSLMSLRTNRIIFGGITLYGAGYGIFITIIPAFLIRSKNSDQTIVGVFFTLFYMALGLSQLIAGPFSDRKGRKPVMVCGLVMAAIGMATFYKLQQPWLIAMLTLTGFGLGVFCVSSMAFLNESVSESLKGTISGAFYFSWGTGYFIGPLILGKMIHFGNSQMGFLLLGGLFMLEFIAISKMIKITPEALKIK